MIRCGGYAAGAGAPRGAGGRAAAVFVEMPAFSDEKDRCSANRDDFRAKKTTVRRSGDIFGRKGSLRGEFGSFSDENAAFSDSTARERPETPSRGPSGDADELLPLGSTAQEGPVGLPCAAGDLRRA